MTKKVQMTYQRHQIHTSSLSELVATADDLIKKYPHLTLETIEVSVDEEYGSPVLFLEYRRPKTEAELEREKADQKIREELDRKHYEALKKKYEG